MKKLMFVVLLSFCSTQAVEVIDSPPIDNSKLQNTSPLSITYENELGELVNEDLTNKQTLIVFWADY